MKILMVAPHLPGPVTYQAGERLVFELIKKLSEKHEIHLVVRIHEGQENDLGPVELLCKKVYPVYYKRPPRRDLFRIPKTIFSYIRLCRRANDLARGGAFDVIHAEWTETGLFLRKRGLMVIEAHDVLAKPMERKYRNAAGARRLLFRILFTLTRIVERRVYAKFNTVFVLSEYDRNYLLSMAPSLNVIVLRHPPGIQLSERMFEREKKTLDEAERGRKQAESLLAALAAEAKCENAERLASLLGSTPCPYVLTSNEYEQEIQQSFPGEFSVLARRPKFLKRGEVVVLARRCDGRGPPTTGGRMSTVRR
jgi:glycosyltransferase involved in cell wall biosynthesis